jgi:sigma-B regulation protein RsbU (phosphoserine phosphatase)
MSRPYRLPQPKGAPTRSLSDRLNSYLRATWSGRILIVCIVVLVLDAIHVPLPDPLVGFFKFVLALFVLSWILRFVRFLMLRLLWRIRTKLLVSYFFIGFVPIVLLLVLFVIAGIEMMILVSSYMVSSQAERSATELRSDAELALTGLSFEEGRAGAILDAWSRMQDPTGKRLSYAVFKKGRLLVKKGDPPQELPGWLQPEGFAGFSGDNEGWHLRAIATRGDATLLLDLPADEGLSQDLEKQTGISIFWPGSGPAGSPKGRIEISVNKDVTAKAPWPIMGVAGIEWTDWATGKASSKLLPIRLSPSTVLRRLSPRSIDFGDTLVKVLLVVGALFLVVYGVALVLGLLLAWSITGSVHALSRGTLRIRNGDFSHPIQVRSRDQLGELAESFNMMVQGIQDLLREQADKERLEEELRIARQIQMSLLPPGNVSLLGLRVDAVCLPAAEVGGDYYDLLPLSDGRTGVLVADVSGKGTSAALYMAELKGLVLSLSRIYESPARLLSEANRILTAHLDPRSFVTMTYAVLDPGAKQMRFSRAGHNPVIQLTAGTNRTQVLAPQGLGLGIDPGDRFDAILEESQVTLAPGDVFLFYTDGLSEAMNGSAELFGERRLRDVIESGSEQDDPARLRERILEGIQGFASGAAQHDDMTMVILKVT